MARYAQHAAVPLRLRLCLRTCVGELGGVSALMRTGIPRRLATNVLMACGGRSLGTMSGTWAQGARAIGRGGRRRVRQKAGFSCHGRAAFDVMCTRSCKVCHTRDSSCTSWVDMVSPCPYPQPAHVRGPFQSVVSGRSTLAPHGSTTLHIRRTEREWWVHSHDIRVLVDAAAHSILLLHLPQHVRLHLVVHLRRSTSPLLTPCS